MGYSQNGAAFFYWAHKRRKTTDEARRGAEKGNSLSDGMVVFIFAALCGLIGAAVQAFNYAMSQVAQIFDAALSLIPFM